MQKNVFNLNQVIEALTPNGNDLFDEKVKELEWFIKLEAVKAVTTDNKAEFVEILEKNDLLGLAHFIKKYVPDFKNKLENFLERSQHAGKI